MVLKQLHRVEYTNLPNALLNDKRLRWKDIGLLAQMLSHPPDWDFSYTSLLSGKHGGQTELQGIVDRLKELGYLKIEKDRSTGKFGKTTWIVADTPFLWNEKTPPQVDYPYMGNPHAEYQHMENDGYTNTYQTNATLDKGKKPDKERKPPSQAKPNAAQDGGHRLLACDGKLYLDPVTNEWRRRNDE